MFLGIAVIALLLKMLFGGIVLCFRIRLCTNFCHVELGTQLFRLRLPSVFRMRIEWSAEDGALILQLKKNGDAKLLTEIGKSGGKRKSNFWKCLIADSNRWLILKKLDAQGCIGVKDDAFECVMLTGALDSALKNSFQIMLNDTASPNIMLRPNFTANIFRLNLEGMFHIRTVQIMNAAFKRYFLKRGSGDYVSSHREHQENHYGAN